MHKEFPSVAKHVPLSRAKFLHSIRTLPKEQALQHLRDHWSLVPQEQQGWEVWTVYASMLPHHTKER